MKSPCHFIRLADGNAAPALGLGTYELQGEQCARAVAEAIRIGYRHLDTAEGYGNEESIARGLRDIDRDELFLTSKVWRDHLRAAEVRRACEGSLRRLGTDYLDLYLIHWPNSRIPIQESVEALCELRARGRIRSWGVSNFTSGHLAEVAALELPATNQVELHPYFRQDALTADCLRLGLPLTAYCPLARGLVVRDPVIGAIAHEHASTPTAVVLAWLLGRGRLAVAKATTRRHMEENYRALELRLSERDRERVDARPPGPRLYDYEWSEFESRTG